MSLFHIVYSKTHFWLVSCETSVSPQSLLREVGYCTEYSSLTELLASGGNTHFLLYHFAESKALLEHVWGSGISLTKIRVRYNVLFPRRL